MSKIVLDFLDRIFLITNQPEKQTIGASMRSRIRIYHLIFFLLLCSNCRKKTDLKIPTSQERFLKVYVELQKLREDYPVRLTLPKDSSRVIIQKYGFTREEYDSCFAYFNEKPERWEAFYREALDQLKK